MQFRDQNFTDVTEYLDGNIYQGCTFTRCTLVFTGGDLPTMKQCRFDGCNWMLEGSANRTLDYLRNIYHGMGQGGRELVERTFTSLKTPPSPPAGGPVQ